MMEFFRVFIFPKNRERNYEIDVYLNFNSNVNVKVFEKRLLEGKF